MAKALLKQLSSTEGQGILDTLAIRPLKQLRHKELLHLEYLIYNNTQHSFYSNGPNT